MEFGAVFWALTAASVLAAAAYGALMLERRRTWLRALVKTAFMAALAAALFFADAPMPLVIAASASAFGDFFLAFDKKWLLPFGILSFLIAQLLYLIIFLGLWMFSGDNAPLWPRYLAMGAIILSSLGFLIWMAPKLRWMALAVAPYAVAITAMAIAAMWLPWAGWPAMLGAVLFLASDLVLATELFRLAPDARVRRFTSPFVWWSYAAAQVLIVWGVIQVAMT